MNYNNYNINSCINRRVCDLYDSGKTVQQIRIRFKGKQLSTEEILNILIWHHTNIIYNHLINKYDSFVVPSKINYNTRIYGKNKVSSSKR